MKQIAQIIQGHFNEAFGLEEEMSKNRLKICYTCPLYSKKLGGVCNSKLYLNPLNGDVSIEPKDGYIRGCSCRLQAKTRTATAHCPAKKW